MQISDHRLPRCWEVLKTVSDPEIPALSVTDLGMIRGVDIGEDGKLSIRLTPTYSGCPATDMLEADILAALDGAGLGPARVQLDLSEAWTTDWMSADGKRKLREYGIAPPQGPACGSHLIPSDGVPCPQCDSGHTRLISEFGSTACKAQYQCRDCLEPFDYFKCI
ncbi:ring-1,2-phenylacetyl-CoA epoxidase subunit PaaD [Oceanisphaera litoralis]|uniref:1,2-phenylacetyl-CoA epoxidase subunit PaaD n=1 Tax=Oceanisphaera litoralis TaxID=225144 RepID=UPI00195780DC|nr:ring-1,2-phenylacetyl-CoA epoxidase subunit PaaD [Oceanisphaera litoralis]